MLIGTSKILVVVFLGVAAGALDAQAPRDLVITQSPGATGGIDYRVTNNRAVPLTGFTVRAEWRTAHASSIDTLIYDSISNGASQPALKRGESYTYHFPPTPAGNPVTEYTVDAAIYADGMTIGDSAAIQSLWGRGQWAVVELQQGFQDLDSAVPDIENPEEAISILKRLEKQRLPHGISREQRDSTMNAYETVIAGFGVVEQQRARGQKDSAAERMAALRQWGNRRIATIKSQVRPAQVTETTPPLRPSTPVQ